MLPTDIIHYILEFVEPDKEVLTNNCKYCSETVEFITKSGKVIDCKDYCLQNIDRWIFNFFDKKYKLKECSKMGKYNIDFTIEKIRINGYDKNKKIYITILPTSDKSIILEWLMSLNKISVVIIETTGFELPVEKRIGEEVIINNEVWKYGIYTREDKYFLEKVIKNF